MLTPTPPPTRITKALMVLREATNRGYRSLSCRPKGNVLLGTERSEHRTTNPLGKGLVFPFCSFHQSLDLSPSAISGLLVGDGSEVRIIETECEERRFLEEQCAQAPGFGSLWGRSGEKSRGQPSTTPAGGPVSAKKGGR